MQRNEKKNQFFLSLDREIIWKCTNDSYQMMVNSVQRTMMSLGSATMNQNRYARMKRLVDCRSILVVWQQPKQCTIKQWTPSFFWLNVFFLCFEIKLNSTLINYQKTETLNCPFVLESNVELPNFWKRIVFYTKWTSLTMLHVSHLDRWFSPKC